MRLLVLIITFTFCGITYAQQPMFQWRDHLPYRNFIAVTNAWDKIYAATPYSLIEIDPSSGEISTISKTNFLSGLNISTLFFDPTIDALMIGYENGNLDIFQNNVFYNMPDIKLANVSGSKKINSISAYDGKAYLACDFGIVVINIQERSVIDSYFIQPTTINVRDLEFFNDSIFATTNEGLYKASLENQFLRDYNAWHKDLALSSILVDENLNQSIVVDDRYYVVNDNAVFDGDTIFKYENNTWSKMNDFAGIEVNDFCFENGKILISYGYFFNAYDSDFNLTDNIFQYSFGDNQPNAAYYDGAYFWIADKQHALVKVVNSYNSEKYQPEGPFDQSIFRMHYQNGIIYGAAGSQSEGWQSRFNRGGIYKFEDEDWSVYNYSTVNEIHFDTAYDFIGVAVDPTDDHHIFGSTSSRGGLYEIKSDGEVIRYTNENSALQERSNNPGFYVIPDIFVDDKQTLWAINSYSGNPLVAKDKDDNWYSYNIGSAATNKLLTDLTIDYNGIKWVSIINSGLIIYDDNGTLDDISDDRSKYLTSSEVNGNLPSNLVNTMVMDLDNEMWVGTSEGFAVFYNPLELFDDETGQYGAQKVLIDGGENTEAVLGKTYITSIDVDGANRKWIGTRGAGVFCLSPDGKKEIYHFTTENSPLFSNNVDEVKINQATGEVFLGTEYGMLSFRTDATYGDDEFSNVYAFPNPVTPEYSGPITVQGLGFDTEVKITDAAGNLVNKGLANGGTYVWDGNDLKGNRVQTGVYLVISGQTGDPKGKNTTKILFIN